MPTERLPATPAATLIGLPRRVAIVVFGLAVVVVAGYPAAWHAAPVATSDTPGYLAVARDLADFRLDELHYRPPGYPMLLRLLGIGDQPPARRLVVVGLCLYMAGLWMLTAVLHGLGLSQRSLACFALLLSLPPFAEPAAYVLSENLTQFLLTASFAATLLWIRRERGVYLAVAGLLLAAAALTKPTYQLLAPASAVGLVVAAGLCGDRRRLRRMALGGGVLTAITVVALAGFALFNGYRFARFTISPGNLPYSLSTKTVKVLERLPDELAAVREAMIAVRDENLVMRGSSHTAEQYYPQARAAVAAETGLEGRELDDLMLRLNLELIAAAPLNYALHVGQSAILYWFPAAGRVSAGSSPVLRLTWAALHFLVAAWFGLQLMVLGGLGLFELSRRLALRRRLAGVEAPLTTMRVTAYVLALTPIVYTMALSCLVHHGEPRFRTVTDPQIVLLCFLGTSMWRRLAVARRGEGLDREPSI